MSRLDEKLFRAAQYLGDLNDSGKVKGFSANERGYATVREFCRGCVVRIHHTTSPADGERLILDLDVTPTARKLHPEICNDAVRAFQASFGDLVQQMDWSHSASNRGADRYLIDISESDFLDILNLIDEVRST